MKAPDFRYEKPATLDDALALMADQDAMPAPLAGGQSLMPMMNFRLAAPDVLIDLNGLDALAGIDVAGDTVSIGAMTRYADLRASESLAGALPLVAKALPHIAHPAIRNRGTIGGSTALADPAAEMPALLLALNARIDLQNQSGARTVAADDFFTGIYETAREDDELVVSLTIPRPADDARCGFHEIVRRHGDYGMAGCAVQASADLSDVRIAFFAVADRALRAQDAETVLAGSDGGADALDKAVAALDGIDFEGDANAAPATKKHLAGVALRRAWAEVMA